MANVSSLKDKALKKLIDMMTEDGAKAIQKAYDTRTFKNQTYNLHDSYASGVYLDGKLLEDTVRYVDSSMATKAKKWGEKELYGRKEALSYLKAHPPRQTGLSLKIVAAMPYSAVLEGRRGTHRAFYNFKVISGANDFMEELARKYGKMLKQNMRGITIQSNVE